MTSPQPPYPIDPELVPLIDPQFMALYTQKLQNEQQGQYLPLEESRKPAKITGANSPIEVQSTLNYSIPSDGGKIPLRIYTPDGSVPPNGWPVTFHIHGGGWSVGNLELENALCTNFASRAHTVVVAVGIRQAPESPFPAAVDDALEGYTWTVENTEKFNGDKSKIAVSGVSTGANLVATLTHLIKERNLHKPVFQLLIAPIVDTRLQAQETASWQIFKDAPVFNADNFLWLKSMYLPNHVDYEDPRASPLLYKDFTNLPPAFISIAGADIHRDAGKQYADKLSAAGVPVQVNIYDKAVHGMVMMNGLIAQGTKILSDACNSLENALSS